MKDALRLIYYMFLLLLLIVSMVSIPYSIIAGVWQFNPTSISWFNTKLLCTGFMVFLITYFLIKLDDELQGR